MFNCCPLAVVEASASEGRLPGACSACGRWRQQPQGSAVWHPTAASQQGPTQAAESRGADRGRARARVCCGALYAEPLP